MASRPNENNVAAWLGLKIPANASPLVKRRAAIASKTMEILGRHAPDMLELRPDANWSEQRRAELQLAVRALVDESDQRDVHNAIAHVISSGQAFGVWDHHPWPLRAIVQLAPSVVSRRHIDRVHEADARRKRLLEKLPYILGSKDEELLTGALVVAAADLSAVLQTSLLEQLLNRDAEFQVGGSIAWFDFRLGSPGAPWRNPRRWQLDQISPLLAARLDEIRPAERKGRVHQKRALRAVARLLDLPAHELTIATLVRTARAWWAMQLPSFLADYAVRPVVSVSLPATAWSRLLTGRPLSKAAAPRPVRALSRASMKRDVLSEQVVRELGAATRRPADLVMQLNAVKKLEKCLRRSSQQKKATVKELRQSLAAWKTEHTKVGGWIPVIGEWARGTLFDREAGPLGRGQGPRVGGLLRYLEGFASRFLNRFWDFPVGAVEEPVEWLARMEGLRNDLAKLASASVARQGLVSLLRFAERLGVPRTEFGEDWRIVESPREADANILAPLEYVRLKDWIRGLYHSVEGSYPALRAEVMLVVAYRMGLRWEELSTLRLKDVVLTGDPIPSGTIWVRVSAYASGKTNNFRRTLAIEHFLTHEERCLLRRFFALATQLGDGQRPGADLLFADPGALDLPPTERETHDLIQSGMRQVSGDPSLVFHHLRHSAASFMYLRVMSDEGTTPNPYPWLAGWEHVSSAAILGPGHNYAATLSGRGPKDPSRLYLISEFLGHLDPETSVKSYIHFADVVLAMHVAELQDLDVRLIAQLDRIKPESVRRRLYRLARNRKQE